MSKKKFDNELCNSNMTFDECELTILRQAVDNTTEIQGKQSVNNESIQKMIFILENFLIRKKCICYGGTAINNILPKDVQFYDKSKEIPDYDFFSKTPIEHAKELSDLYFNHGFSDVEAKSGVHKGTYKVFVNYIPIADITYMIPEIYDNLAKEVIEILGIHYCPPNYLRMSMYLELSRPEGDVSRWEKVMKRLNLLNKHRPLRLDIDCKKVKEKNKDIEPTIFSTIRDELIEQQAVFFGGYAVNLYSNYMPANVKRLSRRVQEFDVLIEKHHECAIILKERLENAGFKKIELIEHDAIEDIIPKHIELKIDKRSYAFIYEPIACHNYNVVVIDKKKVNIATIDTMLSFYLAFTYLNDDHYNKDRILCLAKYLYEVEEHNRLKQHSILKRFSIKCIGKQHGLSEIRAEKAKMFKKLSKKQGTKQYEMWFFKYVPSQLSEKDKSLAKKRIEKYIEEDNKLLKQPKEGEGYKKSIIMKYNISSRKSIKSKSINKKKKHEDEDGEDEDGEDEDEDDDEELDEDDDEEVDEDGEDEDEDDDEEVDEEKDEEDDDEEDDDEEVDEEKDEEQEEEKEKQYNKGKYTKKWNKTGKFSKNKTQKSKFWKKFNKNRENNKNPSKTESSWFNGWL